MPLIDTALEKKAARLERQISKMKEQLATMLRKAKPKPVKDYVLEGHDGKKLKLSQAFGKKQDLIVIHNMGSFCPYCTLWADEANGVLPHLQDRAGVLLVNSEPVDKQKKFKKSRGWKFPMASAAGTTFTHDMGFEPKAGEMWPGFTTFRKRGAKIERVGRRFFGPGDDFCGVWHFFEILSDGPKGWGPKFKY